LIAHRLAAQMRENEATAVWSAVSESPARLVEGLTEFGIPSTYVLWELLTGRRILSRTALDKILSDASETMIRALPRTRLGNLTGFLEYAEWKLPEIHSVVVAALARPDNCQFVVQAALRCRLTVLGRFLEYAELKLPTVYATVLADLSGPEYIETLVQRATTESAALKQRAVHAIVVAGLARPENLELVVQAALRSPLRNLGSFLEYAELNLAAAYSALLAALNRQSKSGSWHELP
jgi:hypothetical protein